MFPHGVTRATPVAHDGQVLVPRRVGPDRRGTRHDVPPDYMQNACGENPQVPVAYPTRAIAVVSLLEIRPLQQRPHRRRRDFLLKPLLLISQ
jgi:hypothetical protein